MNRHHPYATAYESPRRGGSPTSVGPDRNYNRFSERGGPPRGRGRGRGGGPTSANMYSSGSSYDQVASPTGYDTSSSDAYSQWNAGIPQGGYFGQTPTYGDNSFSPYGSPPGGFDSQDYGSYEEGSSSFRGRGRGRGRGNAPRRERDDKVHDSIIEERIQRERPCRTLFIRNIKYETDSTSVRHKFDEYGEIKTFFDLIANRGMVFVTYYDLRAAERARERLQDMEISGRPIDVHYSLPRSEDINNKDERDRNQGTLLVALRNSASGQPIDENEVRRKFQQFGDVKSIKPGDNPHEQRYVEFFDTRACEEAHDRLRHQNLQDGNMEISFSWDIPDVPLPSGPVPHKKQPDDRGFARDIDEAPRGRSGRGRGRGRGRGSGPPEEWERRDDWNRDRERDRPPPRKFDDDYGRGRGGYNGRFEERDGGGYVPPPPATYGPPLSQISGGPTNAYGQNGAAPPVDDRLEQARKVQQLLAALKQPQGSTNPSTPPMPAHSAGPPNTSTYYPQPPNMQTSPYPPAGIPPSSIPNPYGASSSGPQQGIPPPSSTPLGSLPPNVLALLQQATAHPQQSQIPGGQPLPPQFGMPAMPGMPVGGGIPQSTQPGYQQQQLMSYLSQVGKGQ